ncbi:MAG TPA: SDR family oxidoreductase [Kofleriaceae bacterium]|nr:SDR family oxidoreductase [Kofleriaceae bacterium]
MDDNDPWIPEGALAGKVAVITGASAGVGRAIARAFSAAGAKVALIARDHVGLAATADELGISLVCPLDVADAAEVDRVADAVVGRWGQIDIWVNNAMESVFAPVDQITAAEYRRVMEVNYLGYVHGTLAALRHMKKRNRGVIMQIGSALAYRSIPLQSAYCASKSAIRAFSESLRCELLHEKSGIQVTQLHLPAVNTPQFEVVRNRLPGHPQPMGQIHQPELIARTAVRAALKPKRELWIGWPTVKAILGQRVLPGWLDKKLARDAWEGQTTDDVPVGHRGKHRDNLYLPIERDFGAHGIFDDRAQDSSITEWWREHKGAVVVASAAASAIAALAWRWR